MDTGRETIENGQWILDRDTRTWRPGEGHKDMTYGRGTLRHGHWERVTRSWLMKDGHCEMDNGSGTLGHEIWERDTRTWTPERDIGACQGQWIGTLGHRDWERDTKSWTLEGRH